MTNRCEEVSQRIIKTNLHVSMLENLGWKMFSAETLAATLKQSRAKKFFVRAQINILHHVARTEIARSAFRKCHVVDVVQKFREVKEDPVVHWLCLLIYH